MTVLNGVGVKNIDGNCCLRNCDFFIDELHLNRRGAEALGALFSRVASLSMTAVLSIATTAAAATLSASSR